MTPDNGCVDCKFFMSMGDCRLNKGSFFDTVNGVDVIVYHRASHQRRGRRHCPDHVTKVPLWKTIWDKIRRNK